MMTLITAEEAKTALLAAVAAGQVEILEPLTRRDWRGPVEPEVRVGAWTLQFFIEADAVYDIYAATDPAGRYQEYGHDNDPWDLLTEAERVAVEGAMGCPGVRA